MASLRAACGSSFQWAIEGLIPVGSAVAFSGDEGSSKTLLLMVMSKTWTTGEDFFARKVKCMPVLYLGLDVSQVTFQSYLGWLNWYPDEDDDFKILSMWTGDMQPPMLDSAIDMERLYRLAEKNIR
jgi:hypothetical protein